MSAAVDDRCTVAVVNGLLGVYCHERVRALEDDFVRALRHGPRYHGRERGLRLGHPQGHEHQADERLHGHGVLQQGVQGDVHGLEVLHVRVQGGATTPA